MGPGVEEGAVARRKSMGCRAGRGWPPGDAAARSGVSVLRRCGCCWPLSGVQEALRGVEPRPWLRGVKVSGLLR